MEKNGYINNTDRRSELMTWMMLTVWVYLCVYYMISSYRYRICTVTLSQGKFFVINGTYLQGTTTITVCDVVPLVVCTYTRAGCCCVHSQRQFESYSVDKEPLFVCCALLILTFLQNMRCARLLIFLIVGTYLSDYVQ